MALTRKAVTLTGAALLALSLLSPPTASAEDRDVPVPAQVGASIDRPDGRTTVNKSPRRTSCPSGYDEYGVTVRIGSQGQKRVYQCVSR